MNKVIDRVSKVEMLGDEPGIRLVTENKTTAFCSCGFVTGRGDLSPSNHIAIKNNWISVNDIWNDCKFDDFLIFNSRTKKFTFNNFAYIVKIPDSRMVKIETVSGRCGIFGVKSVFLTVKGRMESVNRIKTGVKIVCVEFN